MAEPRSLSHETYADALRRIVATWTDPPHPRQDVRYQQCVSIAREALQRAEAVQPAGPDTIGRVARAMSQATNIPGSEAFWMSMAAVAVAAVGPVGRPCHAPAGESCPTPDLCGNLGCSWPVGRSCEVTDEMVEAAARHMFVRSGGDEAYFWEQMPDDGWTRRAFRDDARAVLEAALGTTAPDGEG